MLPVVARPRGSTAKWTWVSFLGRGPYVVSSGFLFDLRADKVVGSYEGNVIAIADDGNLLLGPFIGLDGPLRWRRATALDPSATSIAPGLGRP